MKPNSANVNFLSQSFAVHVVLHVCLKSIVCSFNHEGVPLVAHLLQGKPFCADAPIRRQVPTVYNFGLEFLQTLFF